MQLTAAIDFHTISFQVSGNCLITNILQNIFFCAQQKKERHTGLEQLKGKVNIWQLRLKYSQLIIIAKSLTVVAENIVTSLVSVVIKQTFVKVNNYNTFA